jgi:hypothetical protein
MMNIEKARRIANRKFTKLFQPIIDNPSGHGIDPGAFSDQVDELKREIFRKTGYEVDQFWVYNLGLGMYDITTTFKTGEKRAESSFASS